MISRVEWLVGTWETQDRDSLAVYEISTKKKCIRVRAYDKQDGEEFLVSKLRLKGEWLMFETYVRSSKFRARHALRCSTRNSMVHELTFIERWIKKTAGQSRK